MKDSLTSGGSLASIFRDGWAPATARRSVLLAGRPPPKRPPCPPGRRRTGPALCSPSSVSVAPAQDCCWTSRTSSSRRACSRSNCCAGWARFPPRSGRAPRSGHGRPGPRYGRRTVRWSGRALSAAGRMPHRRPVSHSSAGPRCRVLCTGTRTVALTTRGPQVCITLTEGGMARPEVARSVHSPREGYVQLPDGQPARHVGAAPGRDPAPARTDRPRDRAPGLLRKADAGPPAALTAGRLWKRLRSQFDYDGNRLRVGTPTR